jgi:hypothetical protein
MEQFYPIDKAVNTLRLLESMKVPSEQEYVIYAYFLLDKPVDGLHGYWIFLGGYSTKERAMARVQEIINETGHQTIFATRANQWEEINEKFKPNRTYFMSSEDKKNKNGNLDVKFHENLKKEQEKEEKRRNIVKDIEEQQENEGKNDTIEHYARNWYLAITNYAKQMYHLDKVKYFKSMFEKRRDEIREQFSRQPEFEEQWLPLYKKRLTERGEDNAYSCLESGHDELYKDILGN